MHLDGRKVVTDIFFTTKEKEELKFNIVELKSREKKKNEERFSYLDNIFNQREELKNAFVAFQDEIWGRTKNNKEWKQLGSLNDSKFNPFLKL